MEFFFLIYKKFGFFFFFFQKHGKLFKGFGSGNAYTFAIPNLEQERRRHFACVL